MPSSKASTTAFGDECLNQHWSLSLDDTNRQVERWSASYTARRTGGSGGSPRPSSPPNFERHEPIRLSAQDRTEEGVTLSRPACSMRADSRKRLTRRARCAVTSRSPATVERSS
jgi:hypothetical protein